MRNGLQQTFKIKIIDIERSLLRAEDVHHDMRPTCRQLLKLMPSFSIALAVQVR